MRRQFLFFYKFSLIIIFFTVAVTTVFAANKDLAAVSKQASILTTDANPRSRSAAAEKLSDLLYKDSVEALVSGLSAELRRDRPNTFVLSAIFVGLKGIADQSFVAAISEVAASLESHPGLDAQTRSRYYSDIQKIIGALPKSKGLEDLRAEHVSGLMETDGFKTLEELMMVALDQGVETDTDLKESYDVLMKDIPGAYTDKAILNLRDSGTQKEFFGRDVEIEQVYQALLRQEKSHVLLTGKAGVGKTTIAKMLIQRWLGGKIPLVKGKVPYIIEMPITDITNPTDPTAIQTRINAANQLAVNLNLPIVLFYDESHVATKMTKNAMKAFLAEAKGVDSKVHIMFATTSQESREFMDDTAFTRRWVEIFVREFTKKESVEAIRTSHLPSWLVEHSREKIKFTGITEDAFEMAAQYAHLEQPDAGNPTGIKELLEGSIIHRVTQMEKSLSQDSLEYELQPEDIFNYLKFSKGMRLVPGDKSFRQDFEDLWAGLKKDYVGNEGFMHSQKEQLFRFFSQLNPNKIVANILAGPPGAGKSFYTDMLAERIFDTKPLVINSTDYSEGGLGLNKLVGSPPGTVGSEEQRSIISKYIRDNQNGGVIVFREADFLHQDVLNWLADLITSKQFVDGLGHEHDMSRFLIYFETNVGQELLVADEGNGQSMTWDELETRKNSILTKQVIGGETVETLNEARRKQVFEAFIAKVAAHSDQGGDTATARENSLKLMRRFSLDYVLLPEREHLIQAAKIKVQDFIQKTQLEQKVTINISEADVIALLDLDKMRFEEGYTWVVNALESKLFGKLVEFMPESGGSIDIQLGVEEVKVGNKSVSGQTLNLGFANGNKQTVSLGVTLPSDQNPWFHNEDMRERIKNFPLLMSKHLMGQDQQITWTHRALKEKALNWNKGIVITQVGTSGNGKTEFGKSLARALWDEKAYFKISGIQRWGDLNNYFRSDTGFSGSREETDFERWFKARRSAGGGVIIFDELLSFEGLSRGEMSERIEAINKLYDVFDEKMIRFGNRTEDASAFVMVITGNAMQELFYGIDDSPEAEKLVQRVLEQTTDEDIIEYFREKGIDAPKLARLGKAFLNGPLDRSVVQLVGHKEVRNAIGQTLESLQGFYDIEVDIDSAIIDAITSRVTTVKLGMRKVNQAIALLITQPIAGIAFDQLGVESISAKLEGSKVVWQADDRVVNLIEREDSTTGSDVKLSGWEVDSDHERSDKVITPKLSDVEPQPKIVFTDEALQATVTHELFGHWMVGYLLEGRNTTDTISVIPQGQALGYVRPMDMSKEYANPSLVSYLKRMAVLHAGHRAEFAAGSYGAGAGGSGRLHSDQDFNNRNDDMAKVEREMNAILSNQMIELISEFSPKEDTTLFKTITRETTKKMADLLIRHGMASGEFDGLKEKLTSERFLSREKIDEYVSGLQKQTRPELLTVWALSAAAKMSARRIAEFTNLNSASVKKAGHIYDQLIRRTTAEIINTNEDLSAEEKKYLFETSSRAREAVKGILATNCTQLLAGKASAASK